MPELEDIYGVTLLGVGTVLYLWRNKRKFDRTNAAGIERFDGYAGKLSARTADAFLWLLAVSSLMTGAIVLAIAHNSTWGWMVILPVAWVMIFGIPHSRYK